MKSVKTILFGICLSAFALCATEPYLSFPLNEGDLAAVKEATGKIAKVNIWNKNQFNWVDGPDGKALSFNTGDKQKTYAGIQFYMPADFDPAKGFTFISLIKTIHATGGGWLANDYSTPYRILKTRINVNEAMGQDEFFVILNSICRLFCAG